MYAVKSFDTEEAWSRIGEAIATGHFTPFLGAGSSSLRAERVDLARSPWREIAFGISRIGEALGDGSPNEFSSKEYLRRFALNRLRLADQKVLDHVLCHDGAVLVGTERLRENGWPHDQLVDFQVALVRLTAGLTSLFAEEFREFCPASASGTDCSIPLNLKGRAQLRLHLSRVMEFLIASDRLEEGQPPRVLGHLDKPINPPLLPLEAIREKALLLAVRLVDAETWQRELQPRLEGNDAPESWLKADREGVNFSGGVSRRFLRFLRVFDFQVERESAAASAARGEKFGSKLRAVFTSIPGDLRAPRPSRPVELKLSTLQWLSDLLWFTFTYWAPLYPTSGELSFRLALLAKWAPPRRAELSQAAEALALTDGLLENVQDILEFPENSQFHPFHIAIGAALRYMYELYAQNEVKQGGVSADYSSDGTPIPILFTTNFDRAIENVLRDAEIDYHVVFPVQRRGSERAWEGPGGAALGGDTPYPTGAGPAAQLVARNSHGGTRGRRNEGERLSLRWYMKTRTFRESEADESELPSPPSGVLALEDASAEPEDFFQRYRLVGPIIVKLHGSPLDEVKDPRYAHWIVLSESGFLDALTLDQRQDRLPPWIGAQLQGNALKHTKEDPSANRTEDRVLWFLGYSLSDWNIRVRLYEHTRYSRRKGSPTPAVVDLYHDRFRVAIFKSLRIEMIYEGDLNLLPRIVCEKMRHSEVSEPVSRLLARLGGN